jgi:hypothetical protein
MSERKRVRIISDGDIMRTMAIDMETGKTLPTVSIDWHADMEDMPTATLKVLFAEVDVETGAEVIAVCPECGGEGAIEELVRLRAENETLKDHVERLKRAVEGR